MAVQFGLKKKHVKNNGILIRRYIGICDIDPLYLEIPRLSHSPLL